MTRDLVRVRFNTPQPSQDHPGLYICPAQWLPQRTYRLAEAYNLIDGNGNVLIGEEWVENSHHCRAVYDQQGRKYEIPAYLPTTF